MSEAWNTEDELDYLTIIGTHSECDTVKRKTRRQMLEGYLRGFNRRTAMGAIDRRTIQRAVVQHIKRCR
jgi:hypothetical protein